MFKYLLFDVDDTLLDFHKSSLFSLIKTFKDYGINLNDEMIDDYMTINNNLWKQFEKKAITREEVLFNRFKLFFDKYNLNLDEIEFNKQYLTNIAYHPFLIENALEVLNDLKENYEIYLVSNGVKFVQDTRLKITGIDKLIKDKFVSEEIGFNKPDVKYFEEVFKRIPNFDKNKALLIGDSLTSDIQGANNVGLQCVYFKHNDIDYSKYKIDYIITNLNELYDILR